MAFSRDAVIIRGGLSSISTLRDNAEDNSYADGYFGVSAWVAPDRDVAALLERLGDALPHRRIRRTTVGELEDRGFWVEETPPAEHVTIHLGGPPTDERLSALESSFGPPAIRPDRGEAK
jgi:hypothetical protein